MTPSAPRPPNEAARLAALQRYAILDTAREASFDRIVRLAARQFDVPIALISLIDADRQWFKAACGLEINETERDIAFCSHTILGDDVLVVPDATHDVRFARNPLVTNGLKIRFYAGAPLIDSHGHALGTLCLVDVEARADFTDKDRSLLTDLAAVVVDHIEMRYATGDVLIEVESRIQAEDDLAAAEHQLRLFFQYVPVPVAMLDRSMRYLAASRRWYEIFGLVGRPIRGRSHYEMVPHLPDAWRTQYDRCLAGEALEIAEDMLPRPEGGFHWVRRQLRPWRERDGRIGGLIVFTEIIDDRKEAAAALEKNRRFLEAVLQNIQDGIIACGADGRLSFFNDAARRFHGRDCEAVPPEDWAALYDLYEPDGKTPLPIARNPLFRAYNGEMVEAQELVVAPKGGTVRRLIASGTPMVDAEGNQVGAVVSAQDVTRERMAEEGWREADARYRAIFDHTFQFCGLLDPEGTLLEANQTALDFGGVSRDDVVGKPVWETFWSRSEPDAQNGAKDAVSCALAGEFVRYEVEVQGKDGVRIPIDFSVKPVMDGAGRVAMLIVEGRDISDKRESEEAVRRNKADLELILNAIPIRIFHKDDKNRILRLNDAAAQSMGSTVAAVEGRNTYDLFPDMAKKYHDDDLDVIESGAPKLGIVEEYTPRDGERGWVRTDKIPHTDPETGERYIFVAACDITAEKAAEQALRESEERYRQLYNKTPVMLHSIDCEGRLISVSDFWLERLGYTRDEVIGRKSSDFLTPESASKAINHVLPRFMQDGVCKDVEYQFVTKSGAVLDVLLSAVAEYGGEGTIERSMAVLTDITERKIVERQFVQAQKMESVGQLTGGLAHDFNNLLGVVLGNLQLMERSLGQDEKTARRINTALDAVGRGAELTRRLLAFSRRQKLEAELLQPNPLIENLSGILQRTLGERIALECRLDARVPCIRTDSTQLESAILNLAVNARDAMPDGGTLTIESAVVTLDEDYAARETDVEPGDYVVLAVSDTGIGIDDAVIQHVFEPFFTTKDVGKGSGLGLSMVYGFMKQSGGHARIYSEVGRGTTVRLYLPAERCTPGAADRPPVEALEGVGGPETILVVEDQDDVREIAVALLEDLGYRVIAAGEGQDALTILRSATDIDLLFTDIVMPGGMDGIRLAEVACHLRPGLPVVFTTGYAEAAVLNQGDVKASSNLVSKPYRRAELAVKVRQALDDRDTAGCAVAADCQPAT